MQISVISEHTPSTFLTPGEVFCLQQTVQSIALFL